MQTTRRGLFSMLAAAIVGLKVAPAVANLVPAAPVAASPLMEELNAITLQCITPKLTDQIFTKSPLFYRLTESGIMAHGGEGGWQNLSTPAPAGMPVVLPYMDDDEPDDDDYDYSFSRHPRHQVCRG